jgi:hypothetical protein
VDGWVSILRGVVLPTTDGTDAGEGHEMSKIADISEPAGADCPNDLEPDFYQTSAHLDWCC